jgi:hypothetical protein
MATNDFLPFAVGGSANVLSQSAYAALSAIANGYSSGIAQSAALNKTWRQSSIMAAVLAQFIANQTGANSVDDGTTATLLANLLAAVKSVSNAVVGTVRNAKMSVSTASATATFTADEIIVETALGGQTFKVASFSQAINLATTGAGGMDTGTAPTSGYVALYAIYNSTTATASILAKDATSAAQPNVYGGANMPAGYAASALIGVWPTNASKQFTVGFQLDRQFFTPLITVLTTTTITTGTTLSIAAGVPLNAKAANIGVNAQQSGTAASSLGASVAANSSLIGQQYAQAQGNSAIQQVVGWMGSIPLVTPQSIWYSFNATSATSPQLSIYTTGYSF